MRTGVIHNDSLCRTEIWVSDKLFAWIADGQSNAEIRRFWMEVWNRIYGDTSGKGSDTR